MTSRHLREEINNFASTELSTKKSDKKNRGGHLLN